MFFILLLILTTTSIAGAAAFFSVYGLAHTFSGTFWSVVWMGGSLEAGKLIAASFAYRYWNRTPWILNAFLVMSIVVLMLLTSVGIFGYLSSGYQTDTLSFKQNEQQTILLEKEEKELQTRKQQIDKQIAELPANFVKGRKQLIDSFQSETGRINKRLPEISVEVQKLKTEQIKAEAHVGPIIYIAKVFDMPTDNATKWLIFLLIFVFDPLAVTLTICVNIALKIRKDDKKVEDKPVSVDYVVVDQPILTTPPIQESTPVEAVPSPQPEPPPEPQQDTSKPLKFEVLDEDPKPESTESPEWLERFKRRANIVESMRTGTVS